MLRKLSALAHKLSAYHQDHRFMRSEVMPIGEYVSKAMLPCLLLVISCSIYAEDCYAQSSGSRLVARKFDEYTTVSLTEERYRLARFAEQVQREAGTRAYVIGYNGRLAPHNGYKSEGARYILAYNLNLGERRVVSINGGFREEPTTELYIVPRGARSPVPRPTVRVDEVVNCPSVSIYGTREELRLGERVSFTAYTAMDTQVQPRFEWSVLGGTIKSGQGTNKINVEVNNPQFVRRVTAAVEVVGYSPVCPNESSHTLTVGNKQFKLDEFGDIPCGDLLARADNLAVDMLNDSNFQVHVVGYGDRNSVYNEPQMRALVVKNYLVDVRGIDASRIKTIDGGYREEASTELWLSPRGMPPPTATPTVDAKYVRFRGRNVRINPATFKTNCTEGYQ